MNFCSLELHLILMFKQGFIVTYYSTDRALSNLIILQTPMQSLTQRRKHTHTHAHTHTHGLMSKCRHTDGQYPSRVRMTHGPCV